VLTLEAGSPSDPFSRHRLKVTTITRKSRNGYQAKTDRVGRVEGMNLSVIINFQLYNYTINNVNFICNSPISKSNNQFTHFQKDTQFTKKKDYDEKIGIIMTIPDEEVKTPYIPVETYIQEADPPITGHRKIKKNYLSLPLEN
jgi:hypothetical protein